MRKHSSVLCPLRNTATLHSTLLLIISQSMSPCTERTSDGPTSTYPCSRTCPLLDILTTIAPLSKTIPRVASRRHRIVRQNGQTLTAHTEKELSPLYGVNKYPLRGPLSPLLNGRFRHLSVLSPRRISCSGKDAKDLPLLDGHKRRQALWYIPW